MANLLRRFSKQVIGTDGRIYDYLAKITASGDFKRVEDLSTIISSWNNIILTPKRTYLHDPEYGSNLHKLIFEPADDATVEMIKTELTNTILYYDDRASIEGIDVILTPNGKGYHLNIHIKYEGVIGTLSVSFDDSTVLPQQAQSTEDEIIT